MSRGRFYTAVVILGLAVSTVATAQQPLPPIFDYQGRLSMSGSPANGEFDFHFDLYDDPLLGSMVAPTFAADDVTVADGLFTVTINFGPVFGVEARWIEVSVREGSSTGPYTMLSPRQRVTPAPIATRALRGVGPPNGLTVLPTGQVGIGVENPMETLHVGGSVWATGELRVGNTITIGDETLPGSDVIEASSGAIIFQDTSILVDTGSVGVGTTSPAEKLDVAGNVRASGTIQSGSSITIDGTTDTITATGGTISFDDENLVTSGDVGIGASAPLGKLHVAAGSDPDVTLENTGDTSVFRRVSVNFRHQNGTGAEIEAYRETGNADGMFLSFKTEPVGGTLTERMRIDPDGNIGVGETSPLAPLHVTSNNLFSSTTYTSGEDLLIEDDGVSWIGLYSDDDAGGIVGGISMVDVDNGNKWAMYRRTTSNVGDLVFTYGINVNPGGNTKMMQLRPDGDVLLAPEMGSVGVGVSAPSSPLHVYTATADTTALFQRQNTMLGTNRALEFGGSRIDCRDMTGGSAPTMYLNLTQDGDVAIAAGGGSVGIREGSPNTPLHVTSNNLFSSTSLLSGEDLLIEDDAAAWIGLYSDDDAGGIVGGVAMVDVDNGNKWAMYRRTTSNVGDLVFTYGANVNPGANEKILQLKPDGTTVVKVLEITGADVAERFPVSDTVEAGMVVEIDPHNPGRLRLARGAYNRRVAGVVSGAGDTPTGAILGNLPGSDGAPPIALSGRVWVYCDATEHAIGSGDLLTTSDTPGHAMAVRDFSRAPGATLGKAMTALPRGGTGLVLTLVNLQ